MTALAEALLAAQRQAIGALQKVYLAQGINDEELSTALDNIGATDAVDQACLMECLHVLHRFGVPAPSVNGARPAALDEPATKAQLDFIAKLSDDKGRVVQTDGMTKAQASQVIEALKRDEEVPF